MLAKNWKRIGMLILIIACLFNVVSKLVKRVSFTDNVKSTVNNVVTQVKGTDNKAENDENRTENE